MDKIDEHIRNLKDTVEKIRSFESDKIEYQAVKPRKTQTENFGNIIQKLSDLQAEKRSLLLEIEELKIMAKAKTISLESEVIKLRDELMTLRNLMNNTEPSQGRSQNEASKRTFKP